MNFRDHGSSLHGVIPVHRLVCCYIFSKNTPATASIESHALAHGGGGGGNVNSSKISGSISSSNSSSSGGGGGGSSSSGKRASSTSNSSFCHSHGTPMTAARGLNEN